MFSMQLWVASFIEIKKFKLKQKLNIMTQKKGKPDYLYTKIEEHKPTQEK